MTPEQRKAHDRMLSELPVHTHDATPDYVRKAEERSKNSKFDPQHCIVKGKEYSSIREAARDIHKSSSVVSYWVKVGKNNSRRLDGKDK